MPWVDFMRGSERVSFISYTQKGCSESTVRGPTSHTGAHIFTLHPPPSPPAFCTPSGIPFFPMATLLFQPILMPSSEFPRYTVNQLKHICQVPSSCRAQGCELGSGVGAAEEPGQ